MRNLIVAVVGLVAGGCGGQLTCYDLSNCEPPPPPIDASRDAGNPENAPDVTPDQSAGLESSAEAGTPAERDASIGDVSQGRDAAVICATKMGQYEYRTDFDGGTPGPCYVSPSIVVLVDDSKPDASTGQCNSGGISRAADNCSWTVLRTCHSTVNGEALTSVYTESIAWSVDGRTGVGTMSIRIVRDDGGGVFCSIESPLTYTRIDGG